MDRFTDTRLARRLIDFKPDHPEGFEHLLETAGFSGATSLVVEPGASPLRAMTVTAGPEFSPAGTTLGRKRPKWLWLVAVIVAALAVMIGVPLVTGERVTFNVNDKQVAVINPDTNDEALSAVYRSDALENEGRLDEAVAAATAAIELQPDPVLLAAAHVNRGNALHDLGRDVEAVADATAAIELQPDPVLLAGAYMNRSIGLESLGRVEVAAADLRTALSLLPPSHELHPIISERLAELGFSE